MMAESSVFQAATYDISHFVKALHSSLYLRYILLIVLVLMLFGYLVDNYGSTDPREPKKLQPSLPLVGHLIGMFSRHMQYYDDL